jgi:hypothetical protein
VSLAGAGLLSAAEGVLAAGGDVAAGFAEVELFCVNFTVAAWSLVVVMLMFVGLVPPGEFPEVSGLVFPLELGAGNETSA